MTNKPGKVVIKLYGLLPIKSHDPIVMWSCKITQQTKTICRVLFLLLLLLLLVLWRMEAVASARSPDKLKPLYFHYQSAHDHQTWQDGNFL